MAERSYGIGSVLRTGPRLDPLRFVCGRARRQRFGAGSVSGLPGYGYQQGREARTWEAQRCPLECSPLTRRAGQSLRASRKR